MKQIYLDNAATTHVDKEVLKEMTKYFSVKYGNPGSFHSKGLEAKEAVDDSRKKIADILNCQTEEIIFTSGGTESVNLAIKGIAFANKSKGNHIITSKIEHHAVLYSCEYLEKNGFDVTYIDVDKYGLVNPEDVKKAITDKTILISIMYANNEIGTIEPIKKIGEIAKAKRIYFHTDACQAGSMNLDVLDLNVDLMTLNSGKIYGPKGAGLLYVKKGVKIEPLLHGGGQEFGLRSGTENVPGIVGFAKALELVQKNKEKENKRLIKLRDYLIRNILKKIPKTILNGHLTERLPNNVNVSFLDIEGEAIVLHLNEYGIYASTGSACTSKSLEPSHVITAIGLPYEASHGSIRFSLGKETEMEDIKYVLKVLPGIVKSLRKISPVKLNIKHFERE